MYKRQVVFPVIYQVYIYFLTNLFIFFYLGVGALYFLFLFLFCFFLATHHPHVGVFLFVCYLVHGTPTRHREGVEACGGVQRSHVNGLGEFLPLFCVVIFVFSFF